MTAVAIAVSLALSVVSPAGAASSGAQPSPASAEPTSRPVEGRIAVARSRAADPEAGLGLRVSPPVTWPKAGAVEVVATATDVRGGPAWSSVGSLPVRVAPTAGAVRVEILDRPTTAAAGVDGVLLRVSRPDGIARPTPVEIDYTGFQYAYGADYGSRLTMVRLGDQTARASNRTAVAEARNDRVHRKLTATVTEGLFAVTATSSGDVGSFQPTSLSPSATWQVGLQSGDFHWSYDLQTPSVPGIAPSVTLDYSSGSVDGRVASTNNQASWIGEGFDYQPGFIERSYRGCAEDGEPSTVLDLCWAGNNAVVSLPGASGPLVRDDATGIWRVGEDEGWRVELLAGAGNGDNDGEHWRLTSPDGTQYYFGLNQLPTWTAGKPETNSAWTVPVFGNQAAEPCKGGAFTSSWCQQAYRWALDYVVDRHGDSMAFFYDKETNYYARNATTPTPYVRGGSLNRIEYGQRGTTVFTTPASATIVFATAERCAPGTACVQSQPQNYPDTPLDQACTASTCTRPVPTFWTTKRLDSITTNVYHGGQYVPVDTWRLTQSYPVPTDGTSPALWLDSIIHTGRTGGTLAMPPITFDGTTMQNRVDTADGDRAMYKRRIQDIYTETGGRTSVKYALQDCLPTNVPAVDDNGKRCFPALWGPGTVPQADWWNKYVVEQVTEADLVGGNPDQVTSFEYLTGGHSWRHDDGELVPERRKSWGQWRGFQTVRVREGPPGGQRTLTEYLFLRGMSGDVNRMGPADTIIVDGVTDDPQWSGFARRTTVFNGDGGPWLERTTAIPKDIRVTARRQFGSGQAIEAHLTGERSSRTETALSDGTVRTTELTTTFDPTYGTADTVEDAGDVSVPDDDTCTKYSYGRNTADWIVGLQSREEIVGVGCGATASYPKDLLHDERSFFDGSTVWGTPPTKGDVTRSQEVADWSDGAVYVDTGRIVVDQHGRTVEEYDSLGNRTTTTYTPAAGGPVTAIATVNPLGHANSVTMDAVSGAVVRSVDVNNRVTELAYDPLGRLTRAWGPGRDRATQSPSAQFTYSVRADGPSSVISQTLLGNGTSYLSTYQILDGALRTRQIQSASAAGGRILTDTRYDVYGNVDRRSDPYWNNQGSAGTTLVDVADSALPAQTRFSYDGAGREVAETFYTNGAPQWSSTTSYGGNTVSVDPPDGDTATTQVFDVRGQTVELRQFHGSSTSGPYDATRYSYTKSGQLSTVVDAAGDTWRHSYDLRGRDIRTEDPDVGVMTTVYDDADRPVSETDARGRMLSTTYDALGRRIRLSEGATTRAEWTFDTLGGGKGMPVAAIRYAGGQAYRQETLGYDEAGRPTGIGITIPAIEIGLAGRYESRLRYNAAGQVTAVQRPAVGDLPAETLTYSYDASLGQLTSLRGSQPYVAATAYTELAEPRSLTLGATGAQVVRTFGYQAGTRRLASATTETKTAATLTMISDLRFGYDATGNLLSTADQTGGDRQCFQVDQLRRLTQAWTPAGGDCAAAPSVSALGGPARYWQSFTYDTTGNRLSEVNHAAGGDTTRSYGYPAAGANQPHALASVATTGAGGSRTDTFGYDSSGNTTSRTVNGTVQTLVWDVEGSVSSNTQDGQSTSYLYDADGDRLIRRDPGGATLYLDGDELRRSTAGTVSSTRYYEYAGDPIAVRGGGSLNWIVADHHDTGELAISASTLAVTRRYQLPFGAPRGTVPVQWPGERGFVGGTLDTSTGLTHLGAREYDPDTGRFLSVDPIIDVTDPQQMNGYAYANNSPASYSDADGLRACADEKCTKMVTPKPKPKPKPQPKAKPKPKPAMPLNTAKTRKESGCAGHNGCGSAGKPKAKAKSKPAMPLNTAKTRKESGCAGHNGCGKAAKVVTPPLSTKVAKESGCVGHNGCGAAGKPKTPDIAPIAGKRLADIGPLEILHASVPVIKFVKDTAAIVNPAATVAAVLCAPECAGLLVVAKSAGIAQGISGVLLATDTCAYDKDNCVGAVFEASGDVLSAAVPFASQGLKASGWGKDIIYHTSRTKHRVR